jgi:hypothetical protein
MRRLLARVQEVTSSDSPGGSLVAPAGYNATFIR